MSELTSGGTANPHAFLSFLAPIRQAFFQDGDTTRAWGLIQPFIGIGTLSPEEKRATYELAGYILRAKKSFHEAIPLYLEIQDQYQAGYCLMLMGELHQVGRYWSDLIRNRPNHWCLTLYGLVSLQVHSLPTLLQIRQHLEVDVANLVQADQWPLLEHLLTYLDWLSQINLESAKFVGRTLLHLGHFEKAEPYLLKAQRLIPNDPELYYHLGQLFEATGELARARLMLNQCLLINPQYQPAQVLLNQVR